jgi:hypothetical protein
VAASGAGPTGRVNTKKTLAPSDGGVGKNEQFVIT